MAGLKFRVLLDSEVKSEVFRDIIIDETASFEVFYRTILEAYNFRSEQMASFYMSNDEWDKGHEITLMDMTFGEEPDAASIMSLTVIKDQLEATDQKIILIHDFLRMWIFLIELIETVGLAPSEPIISLIVGEAPMEDSRNPEDNEDMFAGEEAEEDEFGFDDFEDDFSDEDYSNFDNYEY